MPRWPGLFSQSATAAVGGDLGWIASGQVSDEIEAVVSRLQPGQMSSPVRSTLGYHIMLLRDRRTPKITLADDATVSLGQVLIPVGAADPAKIVTTIDAARNKIRGCEEIPRMTQEVGAGRADRLDNVKVKDLVPMVREAVAKLEVGRASEPLRTEAGILVLMVCNRSGTMRSEATPEPNRDDVYGLIGQQRLDVSMRRYMRDLRRAALVDIRL